MTWFTDNPVITAAIIAVIGSVIVAIINKIKSSKVKNGENSSNTIVTQNQKSEKHSTNIQIGIQNNCGDKSDE